MLTRKRERDRERYHTIEGVVDYCSSGRDGTKEEAEEGEEGGGYGRYANFFRARHTHQGQHIALLVKRHVD